MMQNRIGREAEAYLAAEQAKGQSHALEGLDQIDTNENDLIEPIDVLLTVVHAAMDMQRFRTFTSPFGDAFDDEEPSPFEALNALERLFGNFPDDDDDDDDDIFDFFNPFGPPPGGRRGRSRSGSKKRKRRKR